MDSAVTRNSLALIAAVAVGAALHWLQPILTPLVLAIFLMFLIDGLSREIDKRLTFLPDGASLPVALVLILVAFLGSVGLIIDGIGGFSRQVVAFGERIDGVIANLAGQFNFEPVTVESWLRKNVKMEDVTAAAPGLFRTLGNALSGFGFTFFVLVYLGFLIASRDNFRRKIVTLFPERDDRREAMHVFDRVRMGVEGYIWVQTITGLFIAFGCWAVMAAVGLQNAVFWAFLIFLLSYIPIIGGAVAGCGPALFALVQFPTFWQAGVLFVVIQVWLFVVANLIQPKMQADDQNIDAIVVLLSLAFWGAIWGVTGAFLSTPLTVMAMAVMAEFRGSRWIAVLLSADGDPYPDDDEEEHDDPPPPAPRGKRRHRSGAATRKPPA